MANDVIDAVASQDDKAPSFFVGRILLTLVVQEASISLPVQFSA